MSARPKISEFQYFANEGSILSALAIICIDNPMVAATGNRICNDCSKSCIFQNQEPVDIPSVESKTLVNVLGLTFGFEIYSLLTKWNPLNSIIIYQTFTGKKFYKWPWPIWFYICSLLTPSRTHSSCNRWLKN